MLGSRSRHPAPPEVVAPPGGETEASTGLLERVTLKVFMLKIQFLPRRRTVAAAGCLAFAPLSGAHAANAEPTATAEVVVTAQRLASPAALPSTLETVAAAQIEEGINSVTTAGVLQYLPSVQVRERYIGDRNAVLVMRVNSAIASAQTTVYGNGLLLSNFLNNSVSTARRWGMVSPDEIERVDVMYGPFSTLFPGNSAGGVVQLITRQPKRFEAQVAVDGFTEHFKAYGTDACFSGGPASASLGNAVGDLSLWLALDHLDSQSHPQTFGAATLKTGAAAAAGSFTKVNSAQVYRDIDTAGKPRIIVSSTGIDHTVQDMAKLKLAYHFTPALSASYTLGIWQNSSNGRVDSYLRDARGNTVYNAGPSLANPLKYVRIDGLEYSVAAAAPSRAQSEHWMHGLSLKASTGPVDWELVASLYDQKKGRLVHRHAQQRA